MGKIRVQDLAKMMNAPSQELVFKLKSLGVRVEGDDAQIDTDTLQAILQGKKLPHPREVILRDEEAKATTGRSRVTQDPHQLPAPIVVRDIQVVRADQEKNADIPDELFRPFVFEDADFPGSSVESSAGTFGVVQSNPLNLLEVLHYIDVATRALGFRSWLLRRALSRPFAVHGILQKDLMAEDQLLSDTELLIPLSSSIGQPIDDTVEPLFLGIYTSGAVRSLNARLVTDGLLLRDPLSLLDPNSGGSFKKAEPFNVIFFMVAGPPLLQESAPPSR